ncbi:hypothetical protein M446_5955 [Methylobacterium sp. 4-46]|uniref:hypothetical protein n=1 Tax=unclassified Methylobacterium TaxID=2615210 RepID=UPI000165CB75|nr:hypothetical protein M446_5955 [Methylobacterium sp. 4-46]
MTDRAIDWAAIRAAWCAGASARALARRFAVAHSSILVRARREGWPRGQPRPAKALPDRTPPDRAPADRGRVVAAHRTVIEQGQALTLRLLEEVLAASAQIDALADESEGDGRERANSLAKRSTALRDLAQAARLWIALERQAWGLKDTAGDETPRPDLDAALAGLAPEEREQLRRIAESVSRRSGGAPEGA